MDFINNIENQPIKKIIVIVSFIAIALAVIAFQIYILMVAWNAVLPQLFGLPEISFTQSFWITILITLIFPKNIVLGSVEKCKECL